MLATIKTTLAYEPEACIELLATSMKYGNIDQILDLYESGAVWSSLVSGKLLMKEDRDFKIDYMWLTARNATISVEKMNIVYNAESTIALVALMAVFEGRDPDGKDVIIPFESHLVIRKSHDSSWRIVIDQSRRVSKN